MQITTGPIKVKTIKNNKPKNVEIPADFSVEEVVKAREFHMSFDNYEATPLVSLENLSKALGLKSILVKDESSRFGLNAFKVLGGTYAITQLICQKLGVDVSEIDFDYIKSEAKNEIGDVPFVTATDGNHGRGISWAASQLGQKAIVYLPKNSAKRRVEAIRETGAEAIVTDLNYDDTVLKAQQKAEEIGGYLIQDTAWEGYTDIPRWIMQGYTTMAAEVVDQMALKGIRKPTHVFLQAGVGGMAGAIAGYFVNIYGKENAPKIIIVEPDEAACIFESAKANDGKPHIVEGDLKTIMVGLACGVPSPMAWEILRDFSDLFVTCDDTIAARGVRVLANPLGNDQKIVSGESGAVGIGLLSLMMRNEEFATIREELDLNESSEVLFFNTEGDTDPVNYGEILWDGKYRLPSEEK
ncbi:diaminopropionate ammonia-lyase [Clostridia bacterium]|nr:diaminopropionate ammonia-lyase [Clostridia bacterium]